ncbi:MAG: hypothetical protein IT342_12490 [Candidatus Melainabacteria bacterium]|nr:hypothetical protein [Candidatus Melainabacteria bacterium]
MKTITLLACAAVLGFAFSGTASAQDVRFGVRVGSDRDGFSLRIGVNDRHGRHDHWQRYDRWDRHDRSPRHCPPVVVYPAPRCEPPVVIVEPCPAPIQVTITEIVGYRDERYISGYTKGYERVWDRRCGKYVLVQVDLPVYSIRQVPITVTRVVTANWCDQRRCYGYTDNQGFFQRVER